MKSPSRYRLPEKARTALPQGRAGSDAGFTLVELIVASTILSIIMAAVYVSFTSSVRAWRIGEEGIVPFQDVRSAQSMFNRELRNMITGSEHMFKGKRREMEFFAAVPPMNVRKGTSTRIMWIKYHLSKDPKTKNYILLRDERVVKGPLPLVRTVEDGGDSRKVKLESRSQYEVARDIISMDIRYLWVVTDDSEPEFEELRKQQWTKLAVEHENREGWGRPQAIKIVIVVADPKSETGKTTFTSYIAFNAPTTPMEENRLGSSGEFRHETL